ncbi:hypothetical protein BDZ97DRAFT_1396085 [Flammula alnicola]|nr:hypothetical protein BDZ97DRAFT_1396085 [Flammula alnicola]
MDASVGGNGGGRTYLISSGYPFAHRTMGGGDRKHIYGSVIYGSGYPNGNSTPGVRGAIFRSTTGLSHGVDRALSPSLCSTVKSIFLHQVRPSNNASRPGGPIQSLVLISNYTRAVYRVMSDNDTIIALNHSLSTLCASHLDLSFSDSSITPINDTILTYPLAEQALMYFRASSWCLPRMTITTQRPCLPITPFLVPHSHLLTTLTC